MDIFEKTRTALQKNELIDLLRGVDRYKVETSEYSPCAELTDVGKVLSRGIYKIYKNQPEIEEKLESCLLTMLDKSDFDVYMVCLYIMSQLFKEKSDISPFELNKKDILDKLCHEISKRKETIKNGVIYPSGYKNLKAWEDLERFNNVCNEEYLLRLF
ncbi:MAG: NAD glycohydrolase toxin immunity factor [Gallicola sp.]|nr:NAD glycohydrolase toxin immunity factor [Gallicola sp.]